MQIIQEKKIVEMDGFEADSQKFSIKQNARAFEILSSNIYSDKVLAVVREYGCNAMDAHIAAGKTNVPFEVHLPNSFEPWFAIKDFGIGLSHDNVMGLFSTYFESTKALSDEMVGALGLGSKSGFAYTDQFTVTSRFGGVKRIYNCFVAEDGAPCVTPLDDGNKTDEPNGVEIYMAVKPKDFGTFAEKARKVFFRFPTQPKITGAKIDLSKVEYTLEGTNYKIRANNDSNWSDHKGSYAVQGAVAYPIDVSAFSDKLPEQLYRLFAQAPLDITFPIGELNITASRERLNYDRRTQANLIKMGEAILKELPTKFESIMASATTMWDAKALYLKWLNNANEARILGDLIRGKMQWKSHAVSESPFSIKLWDMVPVFDDQGKPVTMLLRDGKTSKQVEEQKAFLYATKYSRYELDRAKPQGYGQETLSISPHEEPIFVLWDIPNNKVAQARLIKHNYQSKLGQSQLYVLRGDLTRMPEIWTALGDYNKSPNKKIVMASTLELPPEDKAVADAKAQKREVRKMMYINRLSASSEFNTEICTADLNEPGIFVALYDKRMMMPGKETENSVIHTDVALPPLLFKLVNGNFFKDAAGANVRIHAVNSQFKGPLLKNDKWRTAWEYVKPKLVAITSNKQLMDDMWFVSAMANESLGSNYMGWFHRVRVDAKYQTAKAKSPAREAFEELNGALDRIRTAMGWAGHPNYRTTVAAIEDLFDLLNRFQNFVAIGYVKQTDSKEAQALIAKVHKAYPLLHVLANNVGENSAYHATAVEVVKYLNLCDTQLPN